MILDELEGLWRREFIERPGQGADHTTQVHWLQAGRFFCDLRQPADLPSFAGIGCLRDLSREHLRQLALQEGFAGVLALDGRIAQWHRRIDFQPGSGIADRARLAWDGDALMESGTESPYVERWLRERGPATPSWGTAVIDRARGRRGFLVRAGRWMMFARDRPVTLAPGAALANRLAATGTLEAQQDLLDVEISIGRLDPDGRWLIERSTLPFKAGRSWRCVVPPIAPEALELDDLSDGGVLVTRVWHRTAAKLAGRLQQRE